ncbi:hypothetical protein PMAYCL1PPCAC_31811, partial [Pristionchus mayeri]
RSRGAASRRPIEAISTHSTSITPDDDDATARSSRCTLRTPRDGQQKCAEAGGHHHLRPGDSSARSAAAARSHGAPGDARKQAGDLWSRFRRPYHGREATQQVRVHSIRSKVRSGFVVNSP